MFRISETQLLLW